MYSHVQLVHIDLSVTFKKKPINFHTATKRQPNSYDQSNKTACSDTNVPSTSIIDQSSPSPPDDDLNNCLEHAFDPWPEVDNFEVSDTVETTNDLFVPPSVSTPLKNRSNETTDFPTTIKTPQKLIKTADFATSQISFVTASSTSPLVKSFETINETLSKSEAQPLTNNCYQSKYIIISMMF